MVYVFKLVHQYANTTAHYCGLKENRERNHALSQYEHNIHTLEKHVFIHIPTISSYLLFKSDIQFGI